MAMFPCDAGEHRYSGPQRTIYPAIVNQGVAYRRKLRLCQIHFEGYVTHLQASCHSAQAAFDDPMLLACAGCSKLVEDSTWQFFATVYEKGAEREDWWAPLHEACAASQAQDWLIPADMPV